MFRRFLRHKIIRDKDLLLTFPKPPLFPRLLPRTSVGNVKIGSQKIAGKPTCFFAQSPSVKSAKLEHRTRLIGAGAFFCARWGARGAECLPRDVRRRSSQATSRFDGITAHPCLCVRTGSGVVAARPHPRALPLPRTTWAISASRVYSVLQSK